MHSTIALIYLHYTWGIALNVLGIWHFIDVRDFCQLIYTKELIV